MTLETLSQKKEKESKQVPSEPHVSQEHLRHGGLI